MKDDVKQIVRELEKRSKEPFKLEDFLFDKQLTFVKDPFPFKCAVTSRRAGKSVSCAADLCYTAITEPETVGLYITLSRSNAKRIIWPEIKRINRRFKLNGEFNESDLKVTFPNGSVVFLSGASDRTEIDKFRGLALKTVYIDECQAFPNYIESLIDDVIAPALMDHAGTLCLIGTPGPLPSGFFYDASRSKAWAQFHWTFWDNPHIPLKSGLTHDQSFKRELKRRGVSDQNPSIRREWFGEWIIDSDSLVYHYDASLNDYQELPKDRYTYILGVDVGFVDADALAVLAWNENSRNTYLVKELITKKQGLTELVEQIGRLRSEFDISKIVMDMGGLGKKLGEEMIKRYKIPVEAAIKQRKNEYIELFNDSMRTGSFKASAQSVFAHDCMRMEWDLDRSGPDHKIVSYRFHSDICDAVLYAWRTSYSYAYEKPIQKAIEGSKEWADELEQKAEEHFKALEDATKLDESLWKY